MYILHKKRVFLSIFCDSPSRIAAALDRQWCNLYVYRLLEKRGLIYLLLLQNKRNYFTLVLRIETVVDLKVTSALSENAAARYVFAIKYFFYKYFIRRLEFNLRCYNVKRFLQAQRNYNTYYNLIFFRLIVERNHDSGRLNIVSDMCW